MQTIVVFLLSSTHYSRYTKFLIGCGSFLSLVRHTKNARVGVPRFATVRAFPAHSIACRQVIRCRAAVAWEAAKPLCMSFDLSLRVD